MSSLGKSILETVVYFDIFDYPLRVNEIQRWLWRKKADLKEVILTLKNSELLKEKLSSKDGFFFLKNRDNIIEERLKRYRFAEKKFKKAKKIIWLLSKLPNVLGIAVCNDLGYSNSPEDGDIDLFVITKKRQVWTVRFLITLFLKIFHLRPGEAKENAICPSFFVDENNLNLRNLAAISPPEDDIHFSYWINQMTPVFGDKIWRDFYEANQWTAGSLPNRLLFLTNPVRKVKNIFRFPSLFGNWLENLLKFRFLSKEIKAVMNPPTNSIEANLKTDSTKGEAALRLSSSKNQKFFDRIGGGVNKNNNVVIRDGILKLHTSDRRREYYDEFHRRISNFQFLISNKISNA